MTTYYISSAGNNSNTGLGPDASDAVNKPWLTLTKALNTGSPVLPGDTIYIAPGYNFNQGASVPVVTVSSSAFPLEIIGDPRNLQGFKDGSGVLLPRGVSVLTSRTTTSDLDGTPSGSFSINGATNSVDGIHFSQLFLEAANASNLVTLSLAVCADWAFTGCRVQASNFIALGTGVATAGRNLTIKRCVFMVSTDIISAASVSAAATADADLNINVISCLIFTGQRVLSNNFALSASGGNLGGGIHFLHNTVVGNMITTVAGKVSTTTPITLLGNLFYNQGVISAGTAGQVIDSGYNRWLMSAQGTMGNFTFAGTSKPYAFGNVILPDLIKWTLETPRADALGWTDAAVAAQRFSASGNTDADLRNRTPRPWGAGASVGCLQSADQSIDTGSAITGGGTNSLKLVGAGEVSLYVPVSAQATVITVRSKSTSYGGTDYPQIIVVANSRLGMTADKTGTATDASEQVISASTFTPTAKGLVEVRLVSRSTSTTSVTYFDLVTGPAPA